MDRVFRTSSGCVIVVAMAPWKKVLEESLTMYSHRAKAGCEMSDEVVPKVVGCKQGLLDLVVEAELADGHQDCPARSLYKSIFNFSWRIPQKRDYRGEVLPSQN